MAKQGNLLSKTLVIGIVILLIGMSVVSSTDNKIKDISIECPNLESEYNSEILSRSDIAYGYIAYSGSSGYPEGPCYFPLDDPGNITSLKHTESVYFLKGGTWTCDERWFGIEYNSGGLWEIDPETGDMEQIGGGGCSNGDLSYNPVDGKGYGLCGSTIYYDGEVVFVLNGDPEFLIGIACDEGGTLYGWDYYYLWIIDFESGECILVGSHNITLEFGLHGHFDWDTDILYLISGTKLYECDEDSAECTLIGSFEGGVYITCLAIPGGCYDSPPITTHSLDSPEPDGLNGWYVSDVNVTLNATDDMSGVKEIRYTINGGPEEVIWGSSGTFKLTEDGQNIVVDYWAVDNAGNVEPKKTILPLINIDQTPPDTSLCYEIVGGNWWQGWDYEFLFIATDELSGVNVTYYRINGGEWVIYTEPFTLSKDEDDILIEHYSVDYAGNVEDAKSANIPRNRSRYYPLFHLFLDRFPFLEVFLRAVNLLR